MYPDDKNDVYKENRKRKPKPQSDELSRLRVWIRISGVVIILLLSLVALLIWVLIVPWDFSPSSLSATGTASYVRAINATQEQYYRQTQTQLVRPTETQIAVILKTQSATSSAYCVWQPQALDDFSDAFLFRMRRGGISNITLIVEAPCRENFPVDWPRLAFHITLRVPNVEDENALGDEVARVLTVLADDDYMATQITLNVVFAANGAQKYLWSVPLEQALEAYYSGSRGTALLGKLGDLH